MYNITLFGAGRIASVHAGNIASHEQTRLYSVVDPYGESAATLAEKYGACVQSGEEALADPSVDGVLIASPTATHARLIELAAHAGKPIFCEKPIHLDIDRVRACLKVVHATGIALFVGFNRRFDRAFRTVRERFRAGDIGKAESLLITSRDPSPPSARYIEDSGGMFRDMTIHDFDMARFIIGEEPVSIYAQGGNLIDSEIGRAGDIDTAFVVMKFPCGAMAGISNSRRSGYGYDQRLELHGEKGLLSAQNIHEDTVAFWGEQGVVSAKPEYFFLQRYDEAYRAEWRHFVDVLAGRSESECTGHDGEQALRLADKALESLQAGTEIQL